MRTDFFWTPQDREILITLLTEGEHYSAIGRMIGRSRSAVSGFISRNLDILMAAGRSKRIGKNRGPRKPRAAPKPKPPAPPPGEPLEPPAHKPVQPPTPAPPPHMPPPARQPPPQPAMAARPGAPKSLGRVLIDMDSTQCRWPGKDDPDAIGGFRFCGHPVATVGRPYCGYHTRLAGTSRDGSAG